MSSPAWSSVPVPRRAPRLSGDPLRAHHFRMTVNLMQAAGYFLFSGLGGIGDWAAVLRHLGWASRRAPAWRSPAC
jgi:hypothetical protein